MGNIEAIEKFFVISGIENILEDSVKSGVGVNDGETAEVEEEDLMKIVKTTIEEAVGVLKTEAETIILESIHETPCYSLAIRI